MSTEVTRTIEYLIGIIDQHINCVVNNILHHPDVQAVEISWRGLWMIVNEAGDNARVLVKLINFSYLELNADITSAIDFNMSQFFRKIYTAEYDQPGGLPYGLLIGNYYFFHKPVSGVRDGMDLLAGIANITAAAFVPFVSSLAPGFFGLDEFTEFKMPLRLENMFKQSEYHRWRKLRMNENARFLGLTVPRILLRKPYNSTEKRMNNRFFKEKIRRHSDYLWGNAAFAFGCVAIRCFKETGWFADIKGVPTDMISGGGVELVREYFIIDADEFMPKNSVEYQFTDMQEKLLSEEGFLAIRDNKFIEKGVFYSSQSVQTPSKVHIGVSMFHAQMAAMLNYILCVSRFAHYIKIIMRDKVGKFLTADECEHYLSTWLRQYCSTTQSESIDAKARYPLNDAKVEVAERAGMQGKYYCIMRLKPQYQFDAMEMYLKLVTDIKLNG